MVPIDPHLQILIVDDHAEVAKATARYINLDMDIPHNIRIAQSGQDALCKIAEVIPGLIITDMSMPEMGGQELIRIIRGNPAYNDIKIIAMSAEEKEVKIALESGADAFFDKTASMETLISLIRRVINKPSGHQKQYSQPPGPPNP